MISQTPSIGGTLNQLWWEKECRGNSPSFWGDFFKTLPFQIGIFLTFHISVFVNTTAMVVNVLDPIQCKITQFAIGFSYQNLKFFCEVPSFTMDSVAFC